MSALAHLCLASGRRVTGCDAHPGPTARRLAVQGAVVYEGHDPAHLEGVDLLVVSSAVPAENPEVREARRRGLPVVGRGALLAELLNRRRCIAVAGTHGKTTTTAMIASVLLAGGHDPTVAVGADVPAIGGNARLGAGSLAVAEADESDGSFLHLHPEVAVVTNVDDDHVGRHGCYRSLAELQRAFARFLAGVREGGTAVVFGGCPRAAALTPPTGRRRVLYGVPGGDLYAADVGLGADGSSFDLIYGGVSLGRFHLGVPGLHNVWNATAAAAACLAVGCDVDAVREGLARFRPAARRFALVGRAAGVEVFDDYAHHPAEVRATLEAARLRKPRRLRVIFQPHRYSRTALLAVELGRALAVADQLVVTSVYPAGEAPLPGVGGDLVADAARCAGCADVTYAVGLETAAAAVACRCRAGDLCLTMGAGDVHRAARFLLDRLSAPLAAEARGAAEVRGT
ncbi:MAG: UDP-N-acetylmuramate--L-alanine ligase [Clostridia bacterium]|nr:UDP-N-acetylmuramate--L-alanine ligase [Clostridia bacterium]